MHTIYSYYTNNQAKSILAFEPLAIFEWKNDSKWEEVTVFLEQYADEYRFGFFSYDSFRIDKTEISYEKTVNFPKIGLFVPKYVIEIEGKEKFVYKKGEKTGESELFIQEFLQNQEEMNETSIVLHPKLEKEEYIARVGQLQASMVDEKVDAVVYCQEYLGEGILESPEVTFFQLNELSKAPFSSFLRWESNYLLSASPERFLRKISDTLYSEPIKGTAKRGKDEEEDKRLIEELENSDKERAENTAIVEGLVRDFQKIAPQENVAIEEFSKIYSFPTVHQLISRVSAKLEGELSFEKVFKTLFPMGSMTGEPKEKAVDLLDKYENFHRGLYSGSVGYFTPDGDYDFNVVIRTILYDAEKELVSCSVGAGITQLSIPEEEYEECLVKLRPLQEVLKNGK